MNTLTELTKKYGDIAYDPATGEAKGYINFQFLHKTALQRELRLMKKERLIQKGNIDEDPFRFFRKLIRFERIMRIDMRKRVDIRPPMGSDCRSYCRKRSGRTVRSKS